MTELGAPFKVAEIKAALAAEMVAVHDFFAALPEQMFFAAPAGVWTPADNLVHLIKWCQPIVLGLRLPKIALRLRFGKATGPSRPLADVWREYMAIATAGEAIAAGPYLPEVIETSPAERERILGQWTKTNKSFAQNLAKWRDADLDTINVPHPLLGDMTLREILFFTLYHNLHHVNDVERLLGRPESEWFT